MDGSPFLEFAERHDLDYAEGVAPEAQGTFPLPHGTASHLVGGKLPGGIEGIAGRLRRESGGEDLGVEADPTEFTLVVTRIPESTGFARFISCLQQGAPSVLERALGPAGFGWIRDYDFESIEFNRRYRVRMLRTGKEIRLRQLFSPVFLDWMAETAPEGVYWDLVSGALTVTLAGALPKNPADVESACELAAHVAERISSEALESESLDDDPATDAAWTAAERTQVAQIEGAASGATDVGTAAKAMKRVTAGGGFLGRLFGGRRKTEATMLGLVAVMRSYAARNGLEYHQPASLVELMPFLDHFPLPVMRQASVVGAIPETKATGTLDALFDLGAGGELSFRPACEIETGEERGFVHVLPRDKKSGPAPSAIGGFSVALGDGDRLETEPSRHQRERTEKVSEALGGRFDVVADPRAGRSPVRKAAQSWLAEDAGRALVQEDGRLTLVGSPQPVLDWSFETLDGFCRSIAPVAGKAG